MGYPRIDLTNPFLNPYFTTIQHHTIQIHTDTHGHKCSTTLTFCTFCDMHVCQDTNFIFGMSQIYTCTDAQTHVHTSTETPTHTDTDTCTQTYISTHVDIHSHTCIFFLTYTNTHTYMSVQFCLLILYLLATCYFFFLTRGVIVTANLFKSHQWLRLLGKARNQHVFSDFCLDATQAEIGKVI